MSAAAEYNALFDSCTDLINAFKELKLANDEYQKLKEIVYDDEGVEQQECCLLYTSPSPRD